MLTIRSSKSKPRNRGTDTSLSEWLRSLPEQRLRSTVRPGTKHRCLPTKSILARTMVHLRALFAIAFHVIFYGIPNTFCVRIVANLFFFFPFVLWYLFPFANDLALNFLCFSDIDALPNSIHPRLASFLSSMYFCMSRLRLVFVSVCLPGCIGRKKGNGYNSESLSCKIDLGSGATVSLSLAKWLCSCWLISRSLPMSDDDESSFSPLRRHSHM